MPRYQQFELDQEMRKMIRNASTVDEIKPVRLQGNEIHIGPNAQEEVQASYQSGLSKKAMNIHYSLGGAGTKYF